MKSFYRPALAIACVAFSLMLSGQTAPSDIDNQVRNSFIEFPTIVLVGQVVDITPTSVTIGNTAFTTALSPDRLATLRAKLESSYNTIDKGFLRALRLVSVKDDHMQMTFYPDMLAKIFHDDANTYLQYLPLFYLVQNNIKQMQLPEGIVERLKKVSFDYYLTIPFVKKIMKNAWGAAVFQIHPETNKLLYVASRFYEDYDEMMVDDFAKEYMIPQIVQRGMTLTANVSIVRGKERSWTKESIHKKYKKDDTGKNIPDNEKAPNGGALTPGR
ncbi:MAG TPA: hypothetical protein PLV42_00190 [bacterium]|nr:hypothetical protein [bacterium]